MTRSAVLRFAVIVASGATVVGFVVSRSTASGAMEGGERTAQPAAAITGMSVCGPPPARTAPASNCLGGTFDTGQAVVAPDGSGNSINMWGAPSASDEHSSVLPPGDWSSGSEYLFFVASDTKTSRGCCGVVALSSIGGPSAGGRWTLGWAPGYGHSRLFTPPVGFKTCPPGDERFDLNYAAPGSVVPDPTHRPSGLLMVYEGTNKCSAGTPQKNGYHTYGIATSFDGGMHWPVYPASASGLRFWFGGTGVAFCPPGVAHDLCEQPSYGRYAVLAPSTSLHHYFTTHAVAPPGLQQPSAFLDTTQNPSRLYIVVGNSLARATVTTGSKPLTFDKLSNGTWVAPPADEPKGDAPDSNLNDSPDLPMLATNGNPRECGAANQSRQGLSISYVRSTRQYLLLFVCQSPSDPNPVSGEQGADSRGAAWFWATSSSLDPPNWTRFGEISGTWSTIRGGRYRGWYPSIMSLGQQPGQLASNGYVFYLTGCYGKCTGGVPTARTYSSRAFAIETTGNAYAHPPLTRISGPSRISQSSVSFSISSNSPGSMLQCKLDSGSFKPCTSPVRYTLSAGNHVLHARAVNPFGTAGPAVGRSFRLPLPPCKTQPCITPPTGP